MANVQKMRHKCSDKSTISLLKVEAGRQKPEEGDRGRNKRYISYYGLLLQPGK
jgi:hypothetical protein